MVGFSWWGYYVGSARILERAEAFRYRRMAVAQLQERDLYRFFYATNRNSTPEADALEDSFGIERGETLSFGHFDTRIEPSLGLGMLINPTDWFRDEEIDILDVSALQRAALVAELKKQVEDSPYGAVLVLVHGFRNSFEASLRRTAFVGHVLDVDAPILLFDWPANQGSGLQGYRRAHRVARASGVELAETLELILREVQPERLWLLANSMGAEVVVEGFDVLSQQADMADVGTEIEDVILTAPDIDADEFDQQFKRQITALARDLTVYVSSNDRALLMSRVVNRGRRLGQSTLDLDQTAEADALLDLTDPTDDLVTLVDVTPVNRTRNFHNFSLETPEFFDDLFLRLTNIDTPQNRLVYRVEGPGRSVYWVLTQGR